MSKGGATYPVSPLAQLSSKSIHELFNLYVVWLKSGQASLMNAYSGALATADFLHSMGVMTDSAYNNINLLTNIFAGVGAFDGIVGALFGNNALQPVLKSWVEADDNDDKEKEDEFDTSLRSARLAASIQGLLTAGVAP